MDRIAGQFSITKAVHRLDDTGWVHSKFTRVSPGRSEGNMNDSATIRVIALGSAAVVLGWTERVVAAHAFPVLQELVSHLESDCPRFAEARGRVRFAVNQKYAGLLSPLKAGDEVALIPPVSGG